MDFLLSDSTGFYIGIVIIDWILIGGSRACVRLLALAMSLARPIPNTRTAIVKWSRVLVHTLNGRIEKRPLHRCGRLHYYLQNEPSILHLSYTIMK